MSRAKKKAWVNFWIAFVNGQLRRKSFIPIYIAGPSTLFTSSIKKGFAKGEAFCSNLRTNPTRSTFNENAQSLKIRWKGI